MNDDHTLTVIKDRLAEVRDSLEEVYPSIPASEIVARARRTHVRRRLIPGMAGVLALAVAAALAMTTLAPASRHPRVQLAAWTVVTQPGGNVVTIRELRDPAGLQRRLRADGVPATVTFLNQQNPACHPWPGAALYGQAGPKPGIPADEATPSQKLPLPFPRCHPTSNRDFGPKGVFAKGGGNKSAKPKIEGQKKRESWVSRRKA